MQTYYRTSYFANTYGEGTYGCGEYDSASTTSCTTSDGGSGSGSGGLVDTGLLVAVIATVACVIIFVSLLVRFWRRSAAKPQHNLGESQRKTPSEK